MMTLLAEVVGTEGEETPLASPFDELGPPALARRAAGLFQAELRSGFVADGVPTCGLDAPHGGKMFGVLVVEDRDGRCGFLRAFSGMLDGRFDIPGYVPPIFDRTARAAVEPAGERVVKELLARAEGFAGSPEVVGLRRALLELTAHQASALAGVREQHRARRAARRRQALEDHTAPPRDDQAVLRAQQSRRDKAERRAFDSVQAAERHELVRRVRAIDRRLAAFERLRHLVCRRVMRQIHETYRVVSATGTVRRLRELYAPAEPPAGAGDCVAPKLLTYAFEHGLRPLAMAEFWWGAPPPGGGRVAGAFYPACRDKCGPLLRFMLDGLDVAPPRRFTVPDAAGLALPVVFADEWIVVVDKPGGLLSVPARAGSDDSVQARLRRTCPALRLVHRLDLDTSGLLVAARDAGTYAALQRQFLGQRVEKRYAAIVAGVVEGDGGVIDLPIRVDVDDRPRQIHDPVHGRRAITRWERSGQAAPPTDDPAARVSTRIVLCPQTGRTHQLRVHAAHPLGLGAPIVGDRLYGHAGGRLMLHAEVLTFDHPATGTRVTFRSPAPF